MKKITQYIMTVSHFIRIKHRISRCKRHNITVGLLLSILLINGCISPYVGGECKYESIEAYGIVKEIKKDHLVLLLPEKYAFLVDQSHNTKEIKLHRIPSRKGETIPIYINRLTKGSCVPLGYSYR